MRGPGQCDLADFGMRPIRQRVWHVQPDRHGQQQVRAEADVLHNLPALYALPLIGVAPTFDHRVFELSEVPDRE